MKLYHGAHRWSGPPTLQKAGKGRSEFGSGLNLTTSIDTARKYAKGGGKVLQFEIDPSLTLLEDVSLTFSDVQKFLKSIARLKNREKILSDLWERKGEHFPAYYLENLMHYHGALTGDVGPILAEYFVSKGIDASVVRHGSEDWLILYNLDKIESYAPVGRDAVEDLPRIGRRGG